MPTRSDDSKTRKGLPTCHVEYQGAGTAQRLATQLHTHAGMGTSSRYWSRLGRWGISERMEERDSVDAFIDESSVEVNGRKVMIYASVVPHALGEAIGALVEVKKTFGLPPTSELKWSVKGGDAKQKAEVKERVVEVLARNFTCMIAVTEGTDKDLGFASAIRQVGTIGKALGWKYVGIHHDHDTFRSKAYVHSALDSWDGVTCSALADHDSRYSLGIQLADMLGRRASPLRKGALRALALGPNRADLAPRCTAP